MKSGREIEIYPASRLEGHARISIFLDEKGAVKDAFFQILELRGFEEFCKGRLVEEMPRITPRICGVCPWAHHLASAKAADAVYGVEPTEAAKKIREMGYSAFFVHDHLLHFYLLALPDFIPGPRAPPAERNVVGLLNRVGKELGGRLLRAFKYSHEIQEIVGGRSTHPVFCLPGGVSKPIGEDERAKIEEGAKYLLEFSEATLELFKKALLGDDKYSKMILEDKNVNRVNSLAMVGDGDSLSLLSGMLKAVDPEGRTIGLFEPKDYLDHISEHVEPWTYSKFTFLKALGWRGLIDGKGSGVYRVGPLARLNVIEKIPTPKAQGAFEEMFEVLDKPCHSTFAYHWARVIETLYAAERLMELIKDPSITDGDVRNIPGSPRGRGVGAVEAPRGTLIHDYTSNGDGRIRELNLIVPTTHNNSVICMSVRNAARDLIKSGSIDEGLLNEVEMAFRAYDPCLACATHALPGQLPLKVSIFDSRGTLLKEISRP
jgi:F420-non-reducing hydrogenase large subunit